ncbi:sugar phosphate isomerase/epimerase family protein [Arthrobacter sp. MW3 TE3886]|uniref:sugar phosphate isomerase/epimerase family protein n=1 Tax=Arthrobacter sp. MW3 TE3886 TaxID=3156254 RepID=UPI003512E392
MNLDRCSINSITLRAARLQELIDVAVSHSVPGVALWRDVYSGAGVVSAAKQIRSAGLRVTSVCRGGMFPARSASERAAIAADNRRAVDEAHELDAECLVMVCGASTTKDLAAAREQIESGLRGLAPYAADAGVRLAIEPMHPMMIADRSAITSLTEANDVVERIGAPNLGIALDAYHVWWDVSMAAQIQRAGKKLFSVQVCDWVTPITGQLSSRGMPGEGVIDLKDFVSQADGAGYEGLIEIEVLSDRWWSESLENATRAALSGFAGI